ncbi:MAG: GDSL-type esterase/lipase family protein [Planctomycetota bacterium]
MSKNSINLLTAFMLSSVFMSACIPAAKDLSPKDLKKQNPVKIVCLGDSITNGAGAQEQGGYRGPLQRMLTQAGLQYDFVGRYETQGIPDLNHEGNGGMRLVRMLRENEAVAKQALDANPNPEIILLLIGINDLIVNRNTPQATLDRMALLLDELRQYAPNAKIIVGNLVPNASDDPVRDPAGYDPAKTYVNSEDKVLEFNRGLPAVIESKKAQGINVEWVDLHSAMTRHDLSDGIHPNKIGYDKMASVWFKAVMASSSLRRVSPHGLLRRNYEQANAKRISSSDGRGCNFGGGRVDISGRFRRRISGWGEKQPAEHLGHYVG